MPINPLQQFMPRVPRPPDPFAAWMRPAYSSAQQQDEIELSPEAEESILARTGRMGLSGVARVGNFLDLPGSSVRDVISTLATGQVQNPFDQWLPWNWTTDANRVSPGQLNEQLGFISPQFRKEHPVLSFGGDMALGIVTDPLTWFGMPGAARLSQAGQVAKRTGMLRNISRAIPAEMGPRLGAMETSLGTLLQAHGDDMLPLAQAAAQKMGVNLDDVLDQPLVAGRRWLSEGAGKGLAKGLDDLGSFLGKTAPVRGARALFHAPFQGRTPYWEQLVAREQFERMPGARRDIAKEVARFQEDFNELTTSFAEAFGSQFAKEEEIPEAVGQLLRWRGEMQSARKAGTLADPLPPPLAGTFNIPPDQMARFDTLADNVIGSLDKVRNHIDEMGGNIGDIDRYFPRFLGDEMKNAMRIYELRGGSRMLPTSFGPGRSKEIAEIPADVVNEMLTYADQAGLTPFRLPKTKGLSPLARKQNLNQAAAELEANPKFHNWLSPKYGLDEADAAKYADMLDNPQNYNPADILQLEAQGRANHAKDLVKWINDHPESAMFTRDPLSDVTQRAMSMAQLEQGREAIHELFRRNAKTFDPTDNLVKLAAEKVKTGSKFRSRMGEKFITDPDAIGGNWVTLEDAFKSAGLDPKQAMKYFLGRWNETLGKGSKAFTADDVVRLVVPAELANSAKTFTQTLENPQYQNMVLDGIDWMTRIFKQGVTAHPANWVRNWYSGQYTNITASGEIHSVSDLMDYLRFVKESWANRKDPNKLAELIQEGALDPSYLSEGVEHTTKAAQLGANPFNVFESFQGASAAAKAATPVRTLEAILGKPAGAMAGKTGTGALEAAQRTIQTTWGTAMNTSAKASFAVEWMNRAPMYEYLKARGWSPQAAAQKVLELQLDYRHGLAPFEKGVMRRLMPFYSFCVPDDCEILTKDGWKSVDQLTLGEPVLSMNHDTGESDWVPLEAVNTFDYDGELLSIKGLYDDYIFTPTHNWPVFARTTTNESGWIRKIAPGYKLQWNWLIPRSAKYIGLPSAEMTPREAAILGWIVTDGYHRTRTPNHTEFVIYQSPGKYLDEICDLLGEGSHSKSKPHPDTGVVCVRIIGELRARIQSLMRSKADFLKLATRMDAECRAACVDAMMKAEGTRSGSSYTKPGMPMNTFGQEGSIVADAFQILCQLNDVVAQKNPKGVNICSTERTLKIDHRFGVVWFTGRVWCPTTKFGTWLMRRNGRLIWTGNSRLMAPTVLKTLAERPGGAMAHMVKGAARLHGGDALTPEYVSKGLSVPLGETPEGDRRYATASGLPFEDPLSFVGGLRDVGMEVLGRTTPLIKGPAEWATGRSFFQQGPSGGRALEDLDPVIGRTLRNIEQKVTGDTSRRPPPVRTDPFMEAVMSNSPISRYLTTIRTATDPRKTGIEKAFNLLTGARVSTISPAAADAILRERTQVLAKKIGARDFTRTYLPDEVLERLPPHLQQEGQDLKAMLAVLARRAKERAKQAERQDRPR